MATKPYIRGPCAWPLARSCPDTAAAGVHTWWQGAAGSNEGLSLALQAREALVRVQMSDSPGA